MREDKDRTKETKVGWRMGQKSMKNEEGIINWTWNVILREDKNKMTNKYVWLKQKSNKNVHNEVHLRIEN